MSIVGFATRLVAAQILRDNTWAERRIVDSPVDPLAEVLGSGGKPVLALYTGDSVRVISAQGRQTQGAAQTIDLMVYVYVPPSEHELAPSFDSTGQGAAVALDVIERQVDAAFRLGPAEWVAIWNKLVTVVERVRTRPVVIETERGVTIPTVEIVYTLSTVPEPDFGDELYGGWKLLDQALKADGGLRPLAPILADLMRAPAGLPDWRTVQANMGVNRDAMRAIGDAPFDDSEQGEPAVLQDADTHDGGAI